MLVWSWSMRGVHTLCRGLLWERLMGVLSRLSYIFEVWVKSE